MVFLTLSRLALFFFIFFFLKFILILGKFSMLNIKREIIMPATKMRNTAAICFRDTGVNSIFQLTDESFTVCLTVRSRMPDEIILSNLKGTYS